MRKKMPKITMRCVDCGKESNPQYPSVFEQPENEYRCYKCAMNLRYPNNKKVVYKCVDCGKERIDYPAHFKKFEGKEYRCHLCANRKRSKSPKWIENNLKSLEILHGDPEKQNKNLERLRKMHKDPLWLEKIKIINTNKNKRMAQDPDWKDMINIKNTITLPQNPLWKENNLIVMSGQGFWYGHPSINKDPPKYCEIFNEIKPRVRAFFSYTCTKCGKIEKSSSHHVHHIFYEKKTC